MSEKEKMLKGEMYFPNDEELIKLRGRARDIFYEFNQTKAEETEKRKKLLDELLMKKLDNFVVEPPFYCDYGFNIKPGKNVCFNFNCVVLDVCEVKIGDNVLFAPNVQIYTATHPLDTELRIALQEYAKPIEIGDNCWIGGGAIILPGVKIGKNSIIGSGAVVTKDIPDNVVAAGNPAKIIKRL